MPSLVAKMERALDCTAPATLSELTGPPVTALRLLNTVVGLPTAKVDIRVVPEVGKKTSV